MNGMEFHEKYAVIKSAFEMTRVDDVEVKWFRTQVSTSLEAAIVLNKVRGLEILFHALPSVAY